MITPEYIRQMALYGRWQNEKLFALCADLPESERRAERAMFFRSIHHTLDHIATIDRAIMYMVRIGQRPQLELERVVFEEFDTLRGERARIDQELYRLADEHDVAWLGERASESFRYSRGFMITQLFNHQTHHRSQVTSELHRLGIDYGCTDMPYNPYLAP